MGWSWHEAGGFRSIDFIDRMVIDPQTPTTLYAVTTFDGVQKSTDAGVSW
jgi:hypothetical protein